MHHNNNFIHCDIQPGNFLIGASRINYTLCTIDFGLAKRFRNPSQQTWSDFESCKSIHNSSTLSTFWDEFTITANPFINFKYSYGWPSAPLLQFIGWPHQPMQIFALNFCYFWSKISCPCKIKIWGCFISSLLLAVQIVWEHAFLGLISHCTTWESLSASFNKILLMPPFWWEICLLKHNKALVLI